MSSRSFRRCALLLVTALSPVLSPALSPALAAPVRDPVPLLAYYYIWFEPASWERAKSDYPLLGRYSSDDAAVMREHVRSAQAAGIDGFIVSWKSTRALDRRLEQLMEVAAAEHFALWIIYQGLDFERRPLPVARIDSDLETFVTRYATHPAFAMYDKPVVIWSGTWAFERAEIAEISGTYRDDLYLLASERNVAGYQRIADLVDGNAYYWSSVNPETYPDYPGKLRAFSEAVHRRRGLWVAPAAPGFDARLLGGETVVERQDGRTLQRELDAALRSSPDAVGLISWNEFSENTHIEPSERYGSRALEVLAGRSLAHLLQPFPFEFDSSAPGTTDQQRSGGLLVLAGTLAFIGSTLAFLFIRNRREPGPAKGDEYA
jgi:hypothetical protein